MTFFDNIAVSFADVKTENGKIDTVEFLKATEVLVKLMGKLC